MKTKTHIVVRPCATCGLIKEWEVFEGYEKHEHKLPVTCIDIFDCDDRKKGVQGEN